MPEDQIQGPLPLLRSVWHVPHPTVDCDDSLAPGVMYLIVRWDSAHPKMDGVQIKFPIKATGDEFDSWMDAIRCWEVIYLGPVGDCPYPELCREQARLDPVRSPRETVIIARHREQWSRLKAAPVMVLREPSYGFILPRSYRTWVS